MKHELPDELKFLANRKAPQKPFVAPLSGKVCVLTGATSGVGLSATRSLASHGASLVLIARTRKKQMPSGKKSTTPGRYRSM